MLSSKLIVRAIGAVAAIGLIGFIVIQFLPIRPRTNPPVRQEPAWDSPETQVLMERACYDCHSNETKWPAYAYIAPVSWLIVGEVNHGRHELNFSQWSSGENEEGAEAVEAILENEMPPRQYLLLHPEAQLNEAEVQQLVAGLRATFGSGESGEYGENKAGEGDERAYGDEKEDDDEYEHDD